MTKTLIDVVSVYLGYTREQTLQLSERAPKTYRRYQIPKKKRGQRTIDHPSKLTKTLQYALMENFLSRLPIHSCAAAYIRNIKSPLLKNACTHAKFSYSVRIDFSDFFHSISPHDLINQMRQNEIKLSDDEIRFIKNCLFIQVSNRRKGLAIGAPSSPIISNIVMNTLDESLRVLADRISQHATYTRYADDIIFSTNLKGGCSTFYESVHELLSHTSSPSLTINEEKTIFSSRGSRRVVTGLFIQPDGGVSLGRRNKRYIRKLLFDLNRDALPPKSLRYLSGYLAFALDVEPDFHNRLILKYGANLLRRALQPE